MVNRHCTSCGNPGHNARTCGRPRDEHSPGRRKCSRCGEPGHRRNVCRNSQAAADRFVAERARAREQRRSASEARRDARRRPFTHPELVRCENCAALVWPEDAAAHACTGVEIPDFARRS